MDEPLFGDQRTPGAGWLGARTRCHATNTNKAIANSCEMAAMASRISGTSAWPPSTCQGSPTSLNASPLPVYFTPAAQGQYDINIGNRTMERYVVIFDYVRDLITFVSPAKVDCRN
ncbi:MAG: hypothetical protein ACR2KS_03365 [Candidatus Eremiobacter antarcticus]|nr:hypothetical protein [Candidatus Eremiobacteraeota bacterium]MBC5809021.1 hypothetical protein [Candidatus Eremiobacteraeota bacterium]